MGAWDDGLMDNDLAADMMSDLYNFLYKKYFSSYTNKPKSTLDADELLALGNILVILSKAGAISTFGVENIEELIEAIQERCDKEYYSEWNNPKGKKRKVKKLIDKLVKLT